MKKLFAWLAVTIPSPLTISTEAADKQKIGNSIRLVRDLCFVSEERDGI
jgi:hypothetical protein